jgi:hypothetical protein
MESLCCIVCISRAWCDFSGDDLRENVNTDTSTQKWGCLLTEGHTGVRSSSCMRFGRARSCMCTQPMGRRQSLESSWPTSSPFVAA